MGTRRFVGAGIVHRRQVFWYDRRCRSDPWWRGKSSLLRMLPVKPPDALCVFLDLQDNPVATPLDLFSALEQQGPFQQRKAQLYGFWLVEEVNREKRKHAELADVETLDLIVCEKAGAFFRDSVEPRGARFEVRPVIEQIVGRETPELTPAQTRFLVRRGVITTEGKLAFPILARWLNEYAE